jgi:hypothetical protein
MAPAYTKEHRKITYGDVVITICFRLLSTANIEIVVGRLVAKPKREISGKKGGGVAKLVARLLAIYGSSLGSNPDISQKFKNGRHKQRSGQHTVARQKYAKKQYRNGRGQLFFCCRLLGAPLTPHHHSLYIQLCWNFRTITLGGLGNPVGIGFSYRPASVLGS